MVQSSKVPNGEIERMVQSDDTRAQTIVHMRSMFQDLMWYTGDRDPSVVFCDVLSELSSATTKFAPMNSAHEGWAVIAEEFDELWDEVKKKQAKTRLHKNLGGRDVQAMRKEAIQVAAMAIRFVIDVCDGGRGQK